MVDKVDLSTRSRVMSAIRSKGNKSTELVMLQLLKLHHLSGWRRHYKIIGKPDFAWPKVKVALFIDGCFWHGCLCRRAPKSNTEFWDKKIAYNTSRDLKVNTTLRSLGWAVIRVKECQLSNIKTISRIKRLLTIRTLRSR